MYLCKYFISYSLLPCSHNYTRLKNKTRQNKNKKYKYMHKYIRMHVCMYVCILINVTNALQKDHNPLLTKQEENFANNNLVRLHF